MEFRGIHYLLTLIITGYQLS